MYETRQRLRAAPRQGKWRKYGGPGGRAWGLAGVALCLAALTGCMAEDTRDQGARPALVTRPAVSKARLRRPVGAVEVKRAAGDDWLSAVDGMELFENDKVRTVARASALVELANGSYVTLGEHALIGIAETRPRPGTDRTDLTVLHGRVDAELDDASEKSLSVSTPAATVRAGREIVFQ